MYYVIETQENADGTATVLPVHTKATENEALSTWHSILSFAATSNIFLHSCAILDRELRIVRQESFKHIPVEIGDINEN